MVEFLLRRTLTRKQPKYSKIHQTVPVYSLHDRAHVRSLVTHTAFTLGTFGTPMCWSS
jgi:hypothetical protein